jgi:DNA repair exonuclease SbcCD ATPase subunit/predicted phosphodiesterase
MYKIAHFADVHWRGLTRHEEYKRCFEHAFSVLEKEKVDAIFIVGDIVHSKTQGISPELIDSLCWWFRSLSKIAAVYVTLGNHDGLIMNKDREDAISPIIRALNIDNLHLIKMSEKFQISSDIIVSNYSCFDEEGWSSLKPTKDKINIALFHGAVVGSKTDIDWELEGEIDESVFKDYDFVLLGDIHKHQYLNDKKTIAYCGSTIQQNFGETADKGFMVWDIESKEKYSSKHIKVKHDRPFITIDWKGNVTDTLDSAEQYPDFSRFRIRTEVPMSQGEIKQLYSSLKDFKSASEIVMKHDVKKLEPSIVVDRSKKRQNFSDPSSVTLLIRKYYERAGISDRVLSKLDELVNKFWKAAVFTDRNYGSSWQIKTLTFDNTFGYGKGNHIDFDNLEGLTGIFGQNRIGKSSICGTIMYTLFNTTDRGSISNLHVINSRKGHCKTSAVICKSGKTYLVERQTVKRQARNGNISATTSLNLFEINDSGDVIKDLAGEQRRDTEKVLRKIVGNPEDFLLTSFAPQGEMNSFLKQKASSRKTVLSKFLELDIFEKLNEASKEEFTEIKNIIKSVPDRDFDISILDLKNKIKYKTREREDSFSDLENVRSKIRSLEISIATSGDSGLVTSQDVSEQKNRIEVLSERKNEFQKLVQISESRFYELSDKSKKLKDFNNNFPIKELRLAIKEKKEIESAFNNSKHALDKEKQKIKSLKKEVDKLGDVPCGDLYPGCKYILSAHKAKTSLKRNQKSLLEITDQVNATKKTLDALVKQGLDEKLNKYNELNKKNSDLLIEKGTAALDLSNNKNDLIKNSEELISQELKLVEMKANVSDSESAEVIRELRQSLKSNMKSAAALEEKYSAISETIGLLQSDINKLREEKISYDKVTEKWRVFELFQQATSKNGIPLEVIRSRLPEINQEIASILQGVTGFTVELESDEGSNEMNIFINYGDSKRIIETSSGMEKMMSAMAIRVALTNVSALPKANLFIIDEGFGSLDSCNIESCSRFLESLKKWFRSIMIISHVDAIKDEVDNILEIGRKGADAFVEEKK